MTNIEEPDSDEPIERIKVRVIEIGISPNETYIDNDAYVNVYSDGEILLSFSGQEHIATIKHDGKNVPKTWIVWKTRLNNTVLIQAYHEEQLGDMVNHLRGYKLAQ